MMEVVEIGFESLVRSDIGCTALPALDNAFSFSLIDPHQALKKLKRGPDVAMRRY